MDEDVHEPVGRRRGLAWAGAGVSVTLALTVWVGAGQRGDEPGDRRVVTAASETIGAVELPTTTVLPSTTAAPPTTVAVTSTSPTTEPPRTSTTTKSPAPTTTTAPTTSTTARPVANTATVTLANDYPYAVAVAVNGQRVELAPGQQTTPFDVALAANGNDIIEIRIVEVPTCGHADVGGMFPRPGRYRVTIVDMRSMCLADPSQPFPNPTFDVQPA